MSHPKITISLATNEDLHAIATLESQTFHNDPFCTVAFGPLRSSPTNTSRRAIQLNDSRPRDSNGNLKIGEWSVVYKAVDNTTGKIVGGAVWGFVTERMKEKDGENLGIGEGGGEWKQEDWGETANRRFCEEVFLKGDEIMLASTNCLDYAKLSALFVDPSCQRQGIGSKLLEHGLEEVDRRGLQCVLGASKEGRGLYRRFGWVDYEVMVVDLEDYGDVGFGSDEHVLMNRPGRKG